MATKQIAWTTGSGNITLTYQGQGNGTIDVSSDDNKGAARSQVITIKTLDGAKSVNLTVSQTACPVPIGTVLNYVYTGSYQEVELPAGQYKLQCWGAQGGSNGTNSSYGITAKAGGKGGYSEGIITLTQKTTLRVYVGGQGSASAGGFNGGGSTTGTAQYNSGNEFGYSKMGGGGGATDIRLSDGSLLSRMIVAGGGSGGAMCYKAETTTVPVSGTPTSPSSTGSVTISAAPSGAWTDLNSLFNGKKVRIKYSSSSNQADLYVNGVSIMALKSVYGNWIPLDFTQSSYDIKLYYIASSGASLSYELYNSVTAVTISLASVLSHIPIGGHFTDSSLEQVGIRDSENSAVWVFPQHTSVRQGVVGWYFTGNEDFLINGYVYNWNGNKLVQKTTTQTITLNESQIGYVGGGTYGDGYSSTYQGKQNAAGSDGAFGTGANQTTTNYRYCSGAGGGGWYGGGGGQKSDSTMTCCKYSGGGSGFVNTAANAQYRPSGYTGLELDSGTTYDGIQSFPNTTGTGNEIGHSGDGYVKITRLS